MRQALPALCSPELATAKLRPDELVFGDFERLVERRETGTPGSGAFDAQFSSVFCMLMMLYFGFFTFDAQFCACFWCFTLDTWGLGWPRNCENQLQKDKHLGHHSYDL